MKAVYAVSRNQRSTILLSHSVISFQSLKAILHEFDCAFTIYYFPTVKHRGFFVKMLSLCESCKRVQLISRFSGRTLSARNEV